MSDAVSVPASLGLTGRDVSFVKRYTNFVGRVFMRFECATGQVVDVCVRDGRDAVESLTRREAKAEALRRFQVGGV